MKIIITIIIATFGGIIGYKLKVPAGALIGAMIFVALFNIYNGEAYIPIKFKIFAQILTGGIIGLNFSRQTIMQIKEILIPLIISIFILLLFCILTGLILYKITGLDLITALFSMAPGGITDMTLAAQDMGGNTSIIAVFHFVRLTLVVGILPILVSMISSCIEK